MDQENDILSTGTLFWIKAGRRGSVQVPLEFLTEEQKRTLRCGLERDHYPRFFRLETYNAHYVWEEKTGLYEVLVTGIDLSPATKRKLGPKERAPEKFPFRYTLSEMKCLKAQLEAGEVDEVFVQSLLSHQPWKPWETTEWKHLRDAKIQSSCENCGEAKDLLLQHTRQPRKVRRIVYDMVGELMDQFQIYIEQHIDEIDLPLPENTVTVPVCPKCGSSRVRYRQRRRNYVCEKTRNAVTCRYEFTTPAYGYDERTIHDAEKKRVSMLRERFCSEKGIYKLATAIALEEIISYLSMDHVKTLCRSCAFREDRLNQRLCRVCGINFHSAGYAMCKDCAEKQG